MEIGGSAHASVAARPRWVDTGIRLEAGGTYRFAASGSWQDRGIVAGPEGYASPNAVMRFTERWRRVPGAPWFALIGSVDRSRHTLFEIGASASCSPPRDGILSCFANDLSLMYVNNSGTISLTVTRIG